MVVQNKVRRENKQQAQIQQLKKGLFLELDTGEIILEKKSRGKNAEKISEKEQE